MSICMMQVGRFIQIYLCLCYLHAWRAAACLYYVRTIVLVVFEKLSDLIRTNQYWCNCSVLFHSLGIFPSFPPMLSNFGTRFHNTPSKSKSFLTLVFCHYIEVHSGILHTKLVQMIARHVTF